MRRPSLERPPEMLASARESVATLKVELINRLFGGGARARKLDTISWLRPPALKGALRFWWRAANAHTFDSLDRLRAEEERLFGAPAKFGDDGQILGGPGRIEVEVEAASIPGVSYTEGPGSPLTYAYFPARRQQDGTPAEELGHPLGVAGGPDQPVVATVRISFRRHEARGPAASPEGEAKDQAAVLAALQLWLVLGGAGARTRRGAGGVAPISLEAAIALRLVTTKPGIESLLRTSCRPAQLASELDGVFSLARTMAVFVGKRTHASAEEAQKELLTALKRFRQDRKPGKGGGVPGRSNWPEPDAVRHLDDPTKHWYREPEAPNFGRFPRAALGLPIEMPFKDDPPAEPPKQTIHALLDAEGTQRIQRYASPVLLRAVRIWEAGPTKPPTYLPVAIVTSCTLPDTAHPLVQGAREHHVAGYPIVQKSQALAGLVKAFAGAFRKI